MAIDIAALRAFVDMDPDDAMMRFALGQKIHEEVKTPAGLAEALGHLRFAWSKDSRNAVYGYTLGQALLESGDEDQAREVLEAAFERASAARDSEGHDLAPAIRELLERMDG